MKKLKNITLEMSLKPFKQMDDKYIEKVCKNLFSQWAPFLKHSDMVSVMLWTGDGSEILEYKGDLGDTFDWGRYIGGVNTTKCWDEKLDPKGVGIHTRSYLYMESPPVLSYDTLKRIIRMIKKTGDESLHKKIRVGATFDPGPEFAKSDFKYKKHKEICMSKTYGDSSFVCCYSLLHGDTECYAGYREGIPEGTPFGTFFGKQCNHFFKDLDFDFLWLSNGFGFGSETWGVTGAIFDGIRFENDEIDGIKEKILGFWTNFRKECPDIRVETRGTNLTTGLDLATDGVPLKDIYQGDFNIMPPPNSPWAALNGDFGLEIIGYMSHIVELPENDYMFRFYVHDPWWMNSPWIDRYEGQPYDLYMPMAISRMDENGDVQLPSYINFLTVDNCMGEMPDSCPNEIIPHLLNALEHAPDRVSPFLWIYPFDEYHEMVSGALNQSNEVFFGDWFIRGAVNQGLPLSTVVSTQNFIRSIEQKPQLYCGSILITPAPLKDSEFEHKIIEIIKTGGKVVFYGSLENAGEKILKLLNLELTDAMDGLLHVTMNIDMAQDELLMTPNPCLINHRSITSGGGIREVLRDEKDVYTKVLARVDNSLGERIVCASRTEPQWEEGSVAWVRGTNSSYYKEGEWLLLPDNPDEYYYMENLMRLVLKEFEYHLHFVKRSPLVKSPVTMLHRSNNAFFFSGYMPDTTVAMKMRFPLGAPILVGCETEYKKGYSLYHMPRAWFKECRIFVEQEEEGVFSCIEHTPVSHSMRRRIRISGLKNTTLKIFPERGFEKSTEVLLNSLPDDHLTGDSLEWELKDSPWGMYIEVRNATGSLMISTPFSEKKVF